MKVCWNWNLAFCVKCISRRGTNIYFPFRWQRPLGKSIFVLFCCGIRRDEEKETQNINVVGITKSFCSPLPRGNPSSRAAGEKIWFQSDIPENAATLRRKENYRIKEILKEVDTDGSGTMEWDEFVDFFRASFVGLTLFGGSRGGASCFRELWMRAV